MLSSPSKHTTMDTATKDLSLASFPLRAPALQWGCSLCDIFHNCGSKKYITTKIIFLASRIHFAFLRHVNVVGREYMRGKVRKKRKALLRKCRPRRGVINSDPALQIRPLGHFLRQGDETLQSYCRHTHSTGTHSSSTFLRQ